MRINLTRRRWTARVAVGGLLVAGLGTLGGGSALAVHDLGFELDTGAAGANTADDTTVDPPIDWEDLFAGPGDIHSAVTLPNAAFPGFQASGGAADYALPDVSTYATGSKDTLPIAGGWQCSKSNNVGDKVDIVNSYATAYLDTSQSPPHLILYYGVEKSSPTGDSNVAVWFLKDGTVDCANTGGGAKNWTGHHTDGDILLVSAFTNGGGTANVNAYEWQGDDSGSLSTTPMASGQLCGGAGSDDACSVVNKQPLTPPWNHPDKNGGSLDANEFFEGGVDVGPFGAETCFATAVTNTRSSQSLTATLFDFDRFSLPVCGKLEVQKYIDVNLSGTSDAGDVTSGTAVTGWNFSVNGPGAAGPVVCTGATGADGKLVCSSGSLANLSPGTYTVTETQKTGFFNTDAADNTPDPNINEGATVAGTITVGIGGATAKFGNTCFVDKTFQINNVPAGIGTIKVDWTVSSGTHAGATGTETLTGTTTRTGTVNAKFNQLDSISWSWYLASDPANKVTGATNDPLASFGYPACAATNQDSFALTTVSGFKYKDVDNDGDYVAVNGDLPGAGFTFQLKSGATVLQTAVSAADGTYSFANGVAPGTYTVHEVQETGWVQTEPSDGVAPVDDRTVTVTLGQATATVGDFGNLPLSKLDVTLTSLAKNPGTTTDATKASSITCKPSGGSPVTDTDPSGNQLSATSLPIATYECTVVVVDP